MVKTIKKTFTANNNQFLKGKLIGAYQTERISSHGGINLSEFIFNDLKIENTSRCSLNEVFLIEGDFLEKKTLNNISISLLSEKINKDYVFKEDVFSVIIFDIKLNNQVLEGTTVFGTIEAKIICSLHKPSINHNYSPKEDLIIKPPVKEINQETQNIEKGVNWFDFLPELINGSDYFIRTYIASIALFVSVFIFSTIDDSNNIIIYFIPVFLFISSIILIASTTYKRALTFSFKPSLGYISTILNTILFLVPTTLIVLYVDKIDDNPLEQDFNLSHVIIILLIIMNIFFILKNGNKKIN